MTLPGEKHEHTMNTLSAAAAATHRHPKQVSLTSFLNRSHCHINARRETHAPRSRDGGRVASRRDPAPRPPAEHREQESSSPGFVDKVYKSADIQYQTGLKSLHCRSRSLINKAVLYTATPFTIAFSNSLSHRSRVSLVSFFSLFFLLVHLL